MYANVRKTGYTTITINKQSFAVSEKTLPYYGFRQVTPKLTTKLALASD